MYSVSINGKCVKHFKSLRGAYNYYLSIIGKGVNIGDIVEVLSPRGYQLCCF